MAVRFQWLCGLLAVIAVIGWLDLVTGPDVGLALFYLVPIVIAGWRTEEIEILVQGLVSEIEDLGRLHPGSGLGLSAGVVHASGPVDAVDLLRRADEAMYVTKGARKLAASGGRWTRRKRRIGCATTPTPA